MTISYDWYTTNCRHTAVYVTLIVKATRVSDHVEMYVNRIDFRKIMYRLMSQYALEHTKKVCSVCLNHLFQIFPQARRPSSAPKLLKNCVYVMAST